MRPSVRATVSAPTRRSPVSTPVSAGSRSYGLGVDARERGERMGAAHLRHEPGRVPGRAVGESAPLEQHHVGLALAGEVIRDRAADDAAADDHDAGAIGQVGRGHDRRGIEVTVGEMLRDRHAVQLTPERTRPTLEDGRRATDAPDMRTESLVTAWLGLWAVIAVVALARTSSAAPGAVSYGGDACRSTSPGCSARPHRTRCCSAPRPASCCSSHRSASIADSRRPRSCSRST